MSGSLTTAGRLAGVTSIHINGTAYLLVSDPMYSPSRVAREGLVGLDGPHGFSERPRFGFISCVLRDTGSMTVRDFDNMVNVDVVMQLANGKVVTGHEMFAIEAREVNASEGTFAVRFEGVVDEDLAR